MIITTSPSPSEGLMYRAIHLAKSSGGRFYERRRLPVSELFELSIDGLVLILTEKELRLYNKHSDNPDYPFTYHPSMAYVKLKGMLNGQQEPLITYSQCHKGDFVLDCTAGLASDSLLFSLAVGESGKVVSLESELPLYTIVSEGLKLYQSPIKEIEAAMRRIQMINESHDSYIKTLPDKSFDIVYFDPMFRQPLHDSQGIKPLRAVANHNPLANETIQEAKRVARKCVLLKEHAGSAEFHRLGFEPIGKHQHNKPAYGIIWCKEV